MTKIPLIICDNSQTGPFVVFPTRPWWFFKNISNINFFPFIPISKINSLSTVTSFLEKPHKNPFAPTLEKKQELTFFAEGKMYEFGEELIIDSYKVPLLIWIQLLVMILLVLLLFFGFSVLDLPNNSTFGASSSTPTTTGSSHGNPPSNSTITLQVWKSSLFSHLGVD